MDLKDFLNFKVLLSGKFQHTKTNTLGEKVKWSSIREIMYSADSLGELHYRFLFHEDFKSISILRKRTRKSDVIHLMPISSTFLGIPAYTIQHLRDLMPYVDKASRPYYMQFLSTITTSTSTTDNSLWDTEDKTCQEEETF
ncbi:unnamed protein product [Psylliodes chrysocephalus]|uniref:Uncharacterized protein n=1 Tax=Psylliodes chrysocephalus TaxID=3402493 RepID=A0A9P0GH03_9CUCU|nr:unnamed protein product [Psylliodes chrysocephala]